MPDTVQEKESGMASIKKIGKNRKAAGCSPQRWRGERMTTQPLFARRDETSTV